jgi:hypothetical protein
MFLSWPTPSIFAALNALWVVTITKTTSKFCREGVEEGGGGKEGVEKRGGWKAAGIRQHTSFFYRKKTYADVCFFRKKGKAAGSTSGVSIYTGALVKQVVKQVN